MMKPPSLQFPLIVGVFDGNPLEDVSVLGDYENNMKLIMKDGKIYKNTLK